MNLTNESGWTDENAIDLSKLQPKSIEMPNIKFYYSPGSCALAPHILLREIGVEFEGICNNLRLGPLPEEFRLINPKMRVPVISVDDETITELPAIVTMIASLAPEMKLLGKTQLETVRVYEWMNWLNGTVHGLAFKHVRRPMHFTTDPAGCEGITAKARELLVESFDMIESKLEGEHPVGDAYTAVDPYLFVFYRWGNELGYNMKKYPKFTALVARVVERPAVKSTLEVEGIKSTL